MPCSSCPLPAAAFVAPAIAGTTPGMRHPAIAGTRRRPVAGLPHVTPAHPAVTAAHPEVPGGRRNTNDRLDGRRRRRLGYHRTVAIRGDHTTRQGGANRKSRDRGDNEFHQSSSCSRAQCRNILRLTCGAGEKHTDPEEPYGACPGRSVEPAS